MWVYGLCSLQVALVDRSHYRSCFKVLFLRSSPRVPHRALVRSTMSKHHQIVILPNDQVCFNSTGSYGSQLYQLPKLSLDIPFDWLQNFDSPRREHYTALCHGPISTLPLVCDTRCISVDFQGHESYHSRTRRLSSLSLPSGHALAIHLVATAHTFHATLTL